MISQDVLQQLRTLQLEGPHFQGAVMIPENAAGIIQQTIEEVLRICPEIKASVTPVVSRHPGYRFLDLEAVSVHLLTAASFAAGVQTMIQLNEKEGGK